MIEPRLLTRLENKKQLLDQMRPLPEAALRKLREQIEVEWIYNSNAIEGSTLTLRETHMILEYGITIGGKSLREHFEVINHREAIQYVQDLVGQNTPLTAFQVRKIHKLVLAKIDDQNAGQYRQTPVRIVGASLTPPEAWELPHKMSAWEQWVKQASEKGHPIETAARAHHQLAAIHPFIDGNGRTARLVMNLLLMQDGYPPTVIMRTNRRQYYNVLAKADGGNPAPLVNFVARAVERNLTLFLEALTPQTGQTSSQKRWIPLREAAQGTPYGQEYLSLLARKGRLEALKRGKVWYTTREAVDHYIASVQKQRMKGKIGN